MKVIKIIGILLIAVIILCFITFEYHNNSTSLEQELTRKEISNYFTPSDHIDLPFETEDVEQIVLSGGLNGLKADKKIMTNEWYTYDYAYTDKSKIEKIVDYFKNGPFIKIKKSDIYFYTDGGTSGIITFYDSKGNELCKMTPYGGLVIVDNTSDQAYYCKKAVVEFFEENGKTVEYFVGPF